MLKKVISSVALLSLVLFVPMKAGATVYDVPSNSAFKSYMDYRTITSKSSTQYKLQQHCVTDENGLRRYNDCYTVAVGTGWNAPTGTYIDVTLDSGIVLNCIVGDIKQNIHTDVTNKQTSNGNVVEFIVDTDVLSKEVQKLGNISAIPGYAGEFVKLEVKDRVDVDNLRVATNKYIINKYCLPSVDGDCYIIEYSSDFELATVEVSPDIYDSVSIGSIWAE